MDYNNIMELDGKVCKNTMNIIKSCFVSIDFTDEPPRPNSLSPPSALPRQEAAIESMPPAAANASPTRPPPPPSPLMRSPQAPTTEGSRSRGVGSRMRMRREDRREQRERREGGERGGRVRRGGRVERGGRI